ncbi:hypothetical protein halTADL_2467 [Halohasta litchfieldiae]|jgi:hypothetical protein|uniref:Uncharacterized protein n=2 Tax=Halohasta litchfieldiae TaxID=1073996 RepID=A0A1H6Y6U4_9EURY|nr:hypothetical protein [Halohasta litchfieldiae]ATW89205.1 hypothetical protein halTADL_2467 [Halohasta litchfieldiae]SEJ36971.1 hypothetical protein SAMN05444271_1595 [Halohasta litchfieldiae]
MDQIDRATYSVSSVAFILLSVGILLAYRSPATGYELSIYTETTMVYWIGFALSLVVATHILLSKNLNKYLGGTLGGFAVASLLLLPIIRGYHHVGATDAMSHWGTVQDILQAGEILEWRYPALHVGTAIWALITGGSANTMLYMLAVVYGLVFPIFVFLSVRRLEPRKQNAKYIALLSGLLFLPINQLGVRIEAHPTSQAVLFLPVILFATILYYKNLRSRSSVLIVLLVWFYIYLHPQQAANLVLLLGLLSVSLIILDKRVSTEFINTHNHHHFPTLVTGILFWLLMSGREFFVNKLELSVERIISFTGRGIETVEGRASSVDAVGGSVGEIFVKLFLIASIFCGLYVVNVLLIGWSVKRTKRTIPYFELSLTIGVLGVVGMVFFYLAGGISDQFARHLGFVMVVVTILGSLSLARLYSLLQSKLGSRSVQSVFFIFFVCCLALSMPVIHSSSFIYKGSGHVPESHVSGYDTAFEYYDVDQPIVYARSAAFRYASVTTDSSSGIERRLIDYHEDEIGPAPIHFDNQSIHTNENPLYVGVVGSDIARDAELYNGFKFSYDDFAYLENHPDINKVVTNGQFKLYQTPGDQDTESGASNASRPGTSNFSNTTGDNFEQIGPNSSAPTDEESTDSADDDTTTTESDTSDDSDEDTSEAADGLPIEPDATDDEDSSASTEDEAESTDTSSTESTETDSGDPSEPDAEEPPEIGDDGSEPSVEDDSESDTEEIPGPDENDSSEANVEDDGGDNDDDETSETDDGDASADDADGGDNESAGADPTPPI